MQNVKQKSLNKIIRRNMLKKNWIESLNAKIKCKS